MKRIEGLRDLYPVLGRQDPVLGPIFTFRLPNVN